MSSEVGVRGIPGLKARDPSTSLRAGSGAPLGRAEGSKDKYENNRRSFDFPPQRRRPVAGDPDFAEEDRSLLNRDGRVRGIPPLRQKEIAKTGHGSFGVSLLPEKQVLRLRITTPRTTQRVSAVRGAPGRTSLIRMTILWDGDLASHSKAQKARFRMGHPFLLRHPLGWGALCYFTQRAAKWA